MRSGTRNDHDRKAPEVDCFGVLRIGHEFAVATAFRMMGGERRRRLAVTFVPNGIATAPTFTKNGNLKNLG
jgi:hypothetical protein